MVFNRFVSVAFGEAGCLDRLAQGDVVRAALGPTGSYVLACRTGQAALGQRDGHRISGRARGFGAQHQGRLHAAQLLKLALGEGPRQFFGTHVHSTNKKPRQWSQGLWGAAMKGAETRLPWLELQRPK